MMSEPQPSVATLTRHRSAGASKLYQQGAIAGLIGAATIALWFFVLDLITGRPFHTPTVLGTALFRGKELAASPESMPISGEMVLMFTLVHGIVFMLLGTFASRLLGMADKNPNLGFGILLFFVVFMFGFLGWAMIFAEPVLSALTWPTILIGNLLAAATMAVYFWRHHPFLRILP